MELRLPERRREDAEEGAIAVAVDEEDDWSEKRFEGEVDFDERGDPAPAVVGDDFSIAGTWNLLAVVGVTGAVLEEADASRSCEGRAPDEPTLP